MKNPKRRVNLNDATTLISAVAGVIAIVVPLLPHLDKKVVVPTMYGENELWTLDEARDLLVTRGFNVYAKQIFKEQATSKFKDYIDGQVIDSEPRQGEKVAPGSDITLKYVTKEAIDAGRLLSEQIEQQKEITKKAKQVKGKLFRRKN